MGVIPCGFDAILDIDSTPTTQCKMRSCLLILILVLAFSLTVSAQKSDVLVMKNGDRMTCEIKSMTGGILLVSLDYVDGTISVDWSKVASIESSRLFLVKTESGLVYTGKLSTIAATTDAPVRIEVAETAAKSVELPAREVIRIGSTSERFWERFNGDANVGLTYAKGNQSTQFNIGSYIEYPRDRWSARMWLNSTLSSNEGSDTVTRNQLSFNAIRLLRWKNYFASGGADFLQSSEQGVDLQTSFSAGVGRFFKNTNKTRVALTGNLVWQRTKYTDTDSLGGTQNSAAVMVGGEVRLFRFKKTTLNLNAALLPSISDIGRVYFRLNSNYYLKLYSNLNWNLSFYGNWDTRPPFGLPSSDFGTSTGLGWTFGNR